MKRASVLPAIGLSLFLAACGSEGGGSTGTGVSEMSGNVSSSGTADARMERSWLAQMVESLVASAWAQGTAALEGIVVTATAGGRSTRTTTDADGNFFLDDVPVGDLTATFSRGACDATLSLPDTVRSSRIRLLDVDLDCEIANAREIRETFVGVVAIGSPDSILVCVDSGGTSRPRNVRTGEADIEGSTVGEPEPGDEVEITGRRLGQGPPSTVEARFVRVLGQGREVRCAPGRTRGSGAGPPGASG